MSALVYLHGFLGAPAQWDAVRPRCEALVAAGASHAPWLPGHGASPWVPRDAGSFEAALDAFAERLPRGPAVYVGHSMGARLALALYARHPQRVAALVLVGVDPGRDDPVDRAARAAWDEAWAARFEREPWSAALDAWEQLPVFAYERSLDAASRATRRAQRAAHEPRAAAWALRTLGTGAMPPLAGALERATVPVHLVTGALDEPFVARARALRARASRLAHHAVEGAGHDVARTHPDALASIVRAALHEAEALAAPEAPR